MGNIDGREYGAHNGLITPPYNQNPVFDTNNFIDQFGNPAVPFLYIRDFGFSLSWVYRKTNIFFEAT